MFIHIISLYFHMLFGVNNLHRVTSFLSVNIFNDVTTSVLIDTDIQTNHNSLWTTWTEKCTISDINLSSRLCFTRIAGKYCKVHISLSTTRNPSIFFHVSSRMCMRVQPVVIHTREHIGTLYILIVLSCMWTCTM